MTPLGSIQIGRFAAMNGGFEAPSLKTAIPDGLGGIAKTGPLKSAEAPIAAPSVGGAGGASFSNLLERAVGSVDAKMQVADAAKTSLLTGESNNLHQTMIAMQEASVAFSLMVEVRNKLVESYQELMRMQI